MIAAVPPRTVTASAWTVTARRGCRRRAAVRRRSAADRGCRPAQTCGYLPAPDSTRFFSPASARSVMTFSALRLIMPSMGILTSTVSW